MSKLNITKTRTELLKHYPGSHVKMSEDQREMVAEVSDGFAVAVVERSLPHFHRKMQEIYRVLRGTLLVACGGQGHVLQTGETIVIQPGKIHFARAVGEPAWIEVESVPPWSASDHFIL